MNQPLVMTLKVGILQNSLLDISKHQIIWEIIYNARWH